jgi:valyl-tRNA synthetase
LLLDKLLRKNSDYPLVIFVVVSITKMSEIQRCRYRRIVTHGFVLDERGRKMAKSLGNVVEPRAVIENGNGTINVADYNDANLNSIMR